MAGADDRLQLIIDLAQSEISDQWAGAVGLGGMAIGIFLFDGALAGALIAASSLPSSPFDGSWVIPLVGLFGSAVFAFVGATIGRVEAGPELADFDAESEIKVAQTSAKKDLLVAIRKNRAVMRRKEAALGFALALLVLTLVGYGIYVGRDLLGTALAGVGNLLVTLISSRGQLVGLLLVACLAIVMAITIAREG